MLKNFFIFLSLLLLFSCGKNADETITEAVLSANISLGKGDCQSAISTLEAIGRRNDNAPYVKTLASAYACRAGYSTVKFFETDIAKVVNPGANGPLNGAATFSTSQVPAQNPLQNDSSFRDLQTAINILLYAGGIPSTTDPTGAERAKYFSTSVASDINSQLLYMMLVQIGKYLYVYGNSDAGGIKGMGAAANICFTSYTAITDNDVKNLITLSGLTCNSLDASHLQLATGIDAATRAVRKTRLCHGVVLLNGILDLLPNLIASIFSKPADQANADAVLDAIADAKAALTIMDGTIGPVLTTINQTTCEDDTVVTVPNIETYFAGMFESVFQ